ncbi:hypothetical protein CORC01_10655 [Colletotrichum orchidophilum]|uniref:Uncharacterized protein n=1 Tax=Colletotrichum orchidophilum TaxID=1209926 RepID=A0A1G4AY40_9PEZI|nr:uncharacterized protein CORC01_10655 [Colletotrichum orchidophilum]OHE94080.1 hypothetical protein CORC01_10655 [Colletotrichum orchidophilum]
MPDQMGLSAMAQLPGRKSSKVSSGGGITRVTGRERTQPKDGVMPIRAMRLSDFPLHSRGFVRRGWRR